MQQTGSSIAHYISRLQVKRDVPPIGLVEDFFDTDAQRNMQRAMQSQIGIEVPLNPVERQRLRRKIWRMQNPDSPKSWREENRERMRVYSREYRRSERGKSMAKRWRENNREKYNAYQLKWLNENREDRQRRQRERNAERYQNDAEYKQRKLEKGRRGYHAHKAKMIEQHGVEGWKKMQNEKYLKRKLKNESSKS